MAILGVDAGNHDVKVVGEQGTDRFSSKLGNWRDIKLKNELRKDDMVVEFRGQKLFAGTLAEDEAFLPGSKKGVTKANDEVRLRVLLALYRYSSETVYDIVVGQPITGHTDHEKDAIKEMLRGKHEITVNDMTRIIEIRKVEVAAEGASVGVLEPIRGRYHILDVGSGTINWATVGWDGERLRFYDKDSDTEPFGLSTHGDVKIPELATHLGRNLPWDTMDVIRVVGAVAEELTEPLREHFPNASVFKPTVTLPTSAKKLDPVYANAAAFFTIARTVYGKKR